MRYRYFPALIFALLFSAPPLPSSTVLAASEKHELTTINHLILYNNGKVICQGDEEKWNTVIEEWIDDFSHLVAVGEDLYEAAPIVLESLDESEVDIYTPGTYQVRIMMKLEDGFSDNYYISEENRTITIPVYIADETELKLYLVSDSSFAYQFEWYSPDYYLPKELQYLETGLDVHYSADELEQMSWMVCNDDRIATTSWAALIINKPLPKDKAFYFRLKIGDDFTDAVRVTYTDPPSKPDSGGAGGNRDGDDAKEPELPTLSQGSPGDNIKASEPHQSNVTGPAASSPSDDSPGSSKNTSSETVTPTKTSMSGARIRMLLESDDMFVTFAWSGICLRIPREYFASLKLADTDLFTVEMERLSSVSFCLSVYSGDKELTELGSSNVQFSMENTNLPYTLYLNGDKLDTEVSYEDECTSFHVSRTGIYELRAKEPQETAAEKKYDNGSPFPYLAAAVILILSCMSGIILYLRRRRNTKS